MADARFDTVAAVQRHAKRRVPHAIYASVISGSQQGLSSDDNVAAFGELGFLPRVAELSATRDTQTTVMGQTIAFPVIISPTGAHAVHPDGEVAVARAAASRGIPIGLSCFGSKAIEEVAAANAKTFMQVCWSGSRDRIVQRMERARSAGAVGLIVMLDWAFASGRDWPRPRIPERIDLATALRFAPDVLARPRWLLDFVKAGNLPDLTVPNVTVGNEAPPSLFRALADWKQTPPPTWEDLAWMRAQWDGPVMLKGIMRVDEARRAVDTGATAISVSNHGGNNLDGTPAPIRVLPAIADEVGDQIEVMMDGGVRRGADVVKALALGAKAVMIGRAYLWGLAANGQAGVENVLDILSSGIDSTLYGLGHSTIDDLGPGDIVIPEGFTRVLGMPGATR